MQRKLDRRFRSYVISWFLAITTIVISIVGIFFYQTSDEFLISNFQQNKLAHISSMASLIDAKEHAKINNKKALLKEHNIRLTNAIKLASNNQVISSIFSLNYNYDKKQFFYAVDPSIATFDTIVLSLPQVEILLFINDHGELTLSSFGEQFSQKKFKFNKILYDFILAEQNQTKNSQTADLYLNGQKILEVMSQPKLNAKYENITINSKQKKNEIIKIQVDKQNIEIGYRFIQKGQLIHPPGSTFSLNDGDRNLLVQKTVNEITSHSLKLLNSQSKNSFYFVAPITNNQAKTSGMLVMQTMPAAISKLENTAYQTLIPSLILLVIILMLSAIFFSRKISVPVEQLNLAIARLIHNDFNFKLSDEKFGSFGFLARQFNLMLSRIQKSRSELIYLNKSYSRFVPHQLLKQLSHSGVNDISLGDSCERLMTIMFCDIRGFTSLSESMSPSANFKFINRYLNLIAPVINKHGGIIDKYLGDGIMALFPNGADEAISASIEMLEALKLYNRKLEHQKLPIIEVGIGIHTGKTMLGTVGTPSRMDATVISDSVNAAARVEALTKSFCTKILVTEETKRQLKNLSNYKIRYIAACRIQGKSKPVTLYEVYNNDPLSLQKEKAQNQAVMIKAWRQYKNGDTEIAVNMYQKLIEKSPNDKSLFALIERCQSGRL